MRIWRQIIEIPTIEKPREREQENERDNGNRGDGGRGNAAKYVTEGEEGGEPEGEIQDEKGMDGGAAEEGEESCVCIDGYWTEIIGEVAIEDIAAGNAPREVELARKVDKNVGPCEPGSVEHESRQAGIEEKFE